jgi:hypothetical protein|tara:strand:- start:231 stop:533 length:303 start_codon:yes stop_codon:yes gene_type:complete
MTQKKLEQNSKHNDLDLDGDGVVSDSELAALAAVEAAEKGDAQRHMAWCVLAAMGVFTAIMFALPIDRIKAMSDVSNLFYLSGAGLVGAYMSVSVWMSKK